MNQELYRHANSQLAALRAASTGESGSSDLQRIRQETHRLVKFAADVVVAVSGTDAELRLRELADKCRTLTGPGSRFDELRKNAQAHLVMGFHACELAGGGASRIVFPQGWEVEQLPGIRCLAKAFAMPEAGSLPPGTRRTEGGTSAAEVGILQADLAFAHAILGEPDEVLLGLDFVILQLTQLHDLLRSATDAEMVSRDPECRYWVPRADAPVKEPDTQEGEGAEVEAEPQPARPEADSNQTQPEASQTTDLPPSHEESEETTLVDGGFEFVPLPEGIEESSTVREVARGLSEFLARCDAENLRGAWLIMRCGQSFDQRESQTTAFDRLVDQMVMHWPCVPGLVCPAVEELGAHLSTGSMQVDAAASSDLRPAPVPTVRPNPPVGPVTCHPGRSCDEVDYDRFYRLPLMGTKTAIMVALHRSRYCTTADPKHLKILKQLGEVDCHGSGKTWRVYVRSKPAYEAALRYLGDTAGGQKPAEED